MKGIYESDSKEEAYLDRNLAVQLAARLAGMIPYPKVRAGIRENPKDPEWPILYIELPGVGQVSWHLPKSEVINNFVDLKGQVFDGHTIEIKRKRVMAFIRGSAYDEELPETEPGEGGKGD